MDLLIEGEGKASVREITELRDFLRDARLQDIGSVEQKTRPPGPGELGPELLDILQVVLAAPAVLVFRC